MGKYISTNWSRDKIRSKGLNDLVPYRTKKGKQTETSKLTMKSVEMNRPVNNPSDMKWTGIMREPSPTERKKLVAATIAIAVEACLTNHCFKQGIHSFL